MIFFCIFLLSVLVKVHLMNVQIIFGSVKEVE